MDNTPSSLVSIPGISIYRGGQGSGNLLPEFRSGRQSIDSDIIHRVNDSRNQNRETMRIEPLGSKPVEVTGVVQDRLQPDLSKRHNLSRNSIGYTLLTRQIGDTDPVQITVLVDELASDPAAIDYSSYTFLCPRNLVAKSVAKGTVIQALLEPIDAIGVDRFWYAKAVERLV